MVSTMGGSIRMTARLDLVGMNSRVTRRPDGIVKLASKHIDVFGMRAGRRPLAPDSLPIVGPHPADERVELAAGHRQLGVTLSPTTGRLIADFVTGNHTHKALEPLRPDRVQGLNQRECQPSSQ